MSRRRKDRLAEASRNRAERRSCRLFDAARRQWGVVVNMNSAPRLAVRSLLMLATVAACLTAPASPSVEPSSPSADQLELAGIRPEGRLRKLHLVRPDLIPYPIAYEVYC